VNALNDEHGNPTARQLWTLLYDALPANVKELFDVQVSLDL